MSIADMFLKVQGVTGEASDTDHKGEIDIVSWSWGMRSQYEGALARSKAKINDLTVVKRADRASVTLMQYLRNHKIADQALLTVRKAGQTPLEYLTIDMKKVRIVSINHETQGTELEERVTLGFSSVEVTYTPQGASGGKGGGALSFFTDLESTS